MILRMLVERISSGLHPQLRSPRLRRGSTLVELLVCIAIGLILIAILFVVGRLAWNAVRALKGGLGH